MGPRYLWKIFVAVAIGWAIAITCGAAASAAPEKVVIADQFGPGHLVSVVMKRRNLLERRFPGTTFEWRVVTSGQVVRDAMMADQLQVGLSAPPPFLVGVDKGVKWRIIVGAATYDQWLVAADPKIKSLRDFKSGERKQIAVVGLDSFPALAVKAAAQREFGDAKALDSNLVVMPPPQAIVAVLTGQLAGAMVPPVFSVRAVDGGAHVVLRANDVFSGPVTNNFYLMTQSFYERYPDFARGFYDAAIEAIRFIHDSPDEAFRLLAEDEGGKMSAAAYRDLFERSKIEFGPVPLRVLEVGRLMQQLGLIRKAPRSIGDVSFPPLNGQGN